MKIKYIISLPEIAQCIEDTVSIDEGILEGLSTDERNEKITEIVIEEASQRVDIRWKVDAVEE